MERKTLRVVVRVRPLQPHEVRKGDGTALRVQPCKTILHANVGVTTSGDGIAKKFSFDFVAPPETTQAELFCGAGVEGLIDAALGGVNVSVFAYGQTGAGKTHTMGGGGRGGGGAVIDPDAGVIPRALVHLFARLGALPPGTPRPVIRLACLEVYCEGVYDLLAHRGGGGGGALPIRHTPTHGYYVQGQVVVPCGTVEDVLTVLDGASANRSTGSHALNVDSSRSHAVTTLLIDHPTSGARTKVLFVDLAGSERLKESQSAGVTAVESRQINKSLFALNQIISTLSDRASGSGAAAADHVPYRDSKLTQLLQDSLGGTALTVMIFCVTPSASHLDESLNTLQYALRASRIENAPLVRDGRDTTLVKAKKEVEVLRAENSAFRLHLGLPSTGAVSDEAILGVIRERAAATAAAAAAAHDTAEHQAHTAEGAAAARSPTLPTRQGAGPGRGRSRRGTGLSAAALARGGGGSVSGDDSMASVQDPRGVCGAGASVAGGSSVTGRGANAAHRAAERASKQLVIDAQQADLVATYAESEALKVKATQHRARIAALTSTVEDHRASLERLQVELIAAKRAQGAAEATAHQALRALGASLQAASAGDSTPATTAAAAAFTEAGTLAIEVASLREANSLLELRFAALARQGGGGGWTGLPLFTARGGSGATSRSAAAAAAGVQRSGSKGGGGGVSSSGAEGAVHGRGSHHGQLPGLGGDEAEEGSEAPAFRISRGGDGHGSDGPYAQYDRPPAEQWRQHAAARRALPTHPSSQGQHVHSESVYRM